MLAGLLDGYTGVVAYDGLALQDMAAATLSRYVADNISHQGLFDGTLLQNLTLDQPGISADDVAWALELVGLRDELYARPHGPEYARWHRHAALRQHPPEAATGPRPGQPPPPAAAR